MQYHITGKQIDIGEALQVHVKSCMKHLIGLLKPDQGQVLIDGIDINQLPYDELREVRRQFGVLFQGGALFDSMSAFENVAFPLQTFTTRSPKEIEREVLACLEMVELEVDIDPDAENFAPTVGVDVEIGVGGNLGGDGEYLAATPHRPHGGAEAVRHGDRQTPGDSRFRFRPALADS